MDTIQALKQELEKIRSNVRDTINGIEEQINLLARAIEARGEVKREPKPGEIWETEEGIEFLVCEYDLLINLSDFRPVALHLTALASSTYRRMFNEEL